MARRTGRNQRVRKEHLPVEDYRHETQKRKNIPPAKIAAEGSVPAVPKVQYAYSPRRPPVLRFDDTGKADELPGLVAEATRRPLSQDEATMLAEALRVYEPWLEWAGKRESSARGGFAVDPVALHIHERVSAEAILRVAARQDIERTLFGDPELAYHEAIQFYRHDVDWTNRLVLGDSLQVMASLAHREDLAGKVQMIYVDPPYGIRFASNFQPEVGRRDVKDKEQDLTREIETVKAYRDTWHLGIHSYLSYLRERLLLAWELLADSGSIFVQIGDENIHRVRELLDEVFGPEQFFALINYRSMTALGQSGMARVYDYLLWYTRNRELMKFRPLWERTDITNDDEYSFVAAPGGSARKLSRGEKAGLADDESAIFKRSDLNSSGYTPSCVFEFNFQGQSCRPSGAKSWRTNPEGMQRLILANRLFLLGKKPYFRQYSGDFGHQNLENSWHDTAAGFSERKQYVVQTNEKIVQRCLLMTTDPGDLALDPTCGGGTTSYVAEQWGRRWITIDTSRVAIAIARQRLLTAKYDYYRLRPVTTEDRDKNSNGVWLTDPQKQVEGHCTFKCKTVPHITLKSIAQNTNLDPIFAKHEPILDDRLRMANAGLAKVTGEVRQKLATKLLEKQKREGKRAVTNADRRRWELPKKGQKWEHWQVPFDTDPDWPKELQQAVAEYRAAWSAKMDEVNACIAVNAEQEELVDQPERVTGIVRVSGPFTVEAVQPPEESLGHIEERDDEVEFDGAPEGLGETFALSEVEAAAQNVEAYLAQMIRLLRTDGVRFPDNRQMRFTRLEPVAGSAPGMHAEGRWMLEGETDPDPEGRADVAVAFGPQYGPVTATQVEELIRSVNRRGYNHLVVAGFSFDGPAQATIEEDQHPRLRIHIAHIRPDVNPGMTGLLKEQPGSQLFTVFGRPRSRVERQQDGNWVVTLEGVDIYDPVTNTVLASGASKVAAWFIDGDYDGRTFCITQAFFPNRDAWDKLARALSSSDVIDPSVFEALSGTVSLPFPAGQHKRVAIKVIDPRGNEVMQVRRLE